MKNLLKKCNRFFTTYEKIWFLSILILSVVFAFLFPETDDPTYTVKLSPNIPENQLFDRLDFSENSDDFVLCSVTVNGVEYGVANFTDAKEAFTVTKDSPKTLSVKLPVKITKDDEIEIECYPDGENTLFSVSLANASGCLPSENFDLTEKTASPAVTVNPQFFVSVGVIMALYLADTMANVACELLISKQSRWNFLVSLLVELIEIAVCIVCMYRFATLAVTLFFWIPCDIVSFVVWSRHKDEKEEELTVVKALKPWQDILIVLGIVIWTAGVGYLLTFVDVTGGIFGNNIFLKNLACYLDACVSAVGIVNGLFILFRYREQWIAWYISAAIETVINLMAGQFVLLVLKAGYFTNTTYGYIKWTKYIKAHQGEQKDGLLNSEAKPAK